jgi:Spy/CpxP family protein refolding chaperone
MTRSIRILALSAGLLVTAGSVRAADDKPTTRPQRPFQQGNRDPGMMLKMQRQRLDQLDLTADQKKKLDDIYASAEGELKDSAPQDRREKMMAIREKTMAVLTDDQKKKLEQMGPRFGGGQGTGTGPRNPVQHIRDNLDKLNLTSEQKPKVTAVLDGAEKKIDAMRAEMENGNADRQAMMKKGQEIREETRTKLAAILTSEQQEKLRSIMEADRGGPGGPGGRFGGRRGGPTTRPAN